MNKCNGVDYCDVCTYMNTVPKRGGTLTNRREINKSVYYEPATFRSVCADMNCINQLKKKDCFICKNCDAYVFYEDADPDSNEYFASNYLDYHPHVCEKIPKWVPNLEIMQGVWETMAGPVKVKTDIVFYTEKSQSNPRWIETKPGTKEIWLEPDHKKLVLDECIRARNPNSTKESLMWATQGTNEEKNETWTRLIIPFEPLGPHKSSKSNKKLPKVTNTVEFRMEAYDGVKEACDQLVADINRKYRMKN